jgi:hypothetical protein
MSMAREARPRRAPLHHEPWHPAAWQPADAAAIQALAAGTAGAAQQQRALAWIINGAAQTYDEPFVPGSDDVRCYLLGRRSVGQQVVKLMKVKLGGAAKEQA